MKVEGLFKIDMDTTAAGSLWRWIQVWKKCIFVNLAVLFEVTSLKWTARSIQMHYTLFAKLHHGGAGHLQANKSLERDFRMNAGVYSFWWLHWRLGSYLVVFRWVDMAGDFSATIATMINDMIMWRLDCIPKVIFLDYYSSVMWTPSPSFRILEKLFYLFYHNKKYHIFEHHLCQLFCRFICTFIMMFTVRKMSM